jgi:hypothetical protein
MPYSSDRALLIELDARYRPYVFRKTTGQKPSNSAPGFAPFFWTPRSMRDTAKPILRLRAASLRRRPELEPATLRLTAVPIVFMLIAVE